MQMLGKEYCLFFDTNALRGEYWIRKDLEKKLKSLKKEDRVSFIFLLPEVVSQEWTVFFRTCVRQQLEKINTAYKSLGEMTVVGDSSIELSEEQIDAKAALLLKGLNFTVVPTPYEKIDTPMLINRAVEHQAPFNEKSDKGIKDAIIAHTIFEYAQSSKSQVVVIGNDGKFKEYLELLFGKRQVDFYGNLDEFESAIKLELNKLDKELAEKAYKAFHDADNKQTFYHTLGIAALLNSEYDKRFSNIEVLKQRMNTIPDIEGKTSDPYSFGQLPSSRAKKQSVSMYEPFFVEKEKNRLVWATDIELTKYYDESASMYSFQHEVTFTVVWSAILDKGEFTKPKLDSIEEVDESKHVRRKMLYAPEDILSGYQGIIPGIKDSYITGEPYNPLELPNELVTRNAYL